MIHLIIKCNRIHYVLPVCQQLFICKFKFHHLVICRFPLLIQDIRIQIQMYLHCLCTDITPYRKYFSIKPKSEQCFNPSVNRRYAKIEIKPVIFLMITVITGICLLSQAGSQQIPIIHLRIPALITFFCCQGSPVRIARHKMFNITVHLCISANSPFAVAADISLLCKQAIPQFPIFFRAA